MWEKKRPKILSTMDPSYGLKVFISCSSVGTGCSRGESSMGCSVNMCSDVVLHRLQGDNLPLPWCSPGTARGKPASTVLFTTGCRGIPALVSAARPLPPSHPWCLHGCFSHVFLTPPPQLLPSILTLSYKYYQRGNTSVSDGLSSGQQWVCFGAGWDCLQHGSGSWCPLAEATLASPCHHHLTTQAHCRGRCWKWMRKQERGCSPTSS